MLSPLTLAGSASAVAAAAWFVPLGVDGRWTRVLVAVAAAVACAGALLLRRWDRAAGRRIGELLALRTRDEWRADERIAELENDVEESREIRHRLEADLRARRAELTRLRNEHAELLRRYANAETERARALESRRRLALEAGAPPRRAIEAPAGPVGAAAYRRADAALTRLAGNAARQQAARTVEAARRREAATGDADEQPGRHAQRADRPAPAPAVPDRRHHLVPAASAVLPYAQPSRPASRAQGGFDFFGVHKQQAAGRPRPAEPRPEQPEVIDLTAHDDTEQLDVSGLRAHS